MKTTVKILFTALSMILAAAANAEEFKSIWKYTSQDEIIDAGGKKNTAVVTKKEIIFLNKEGAPTGGDAGVVETTYPLAENQFAAVSGDGNAIAVITHRPQIKEQIEKTELFGFPALSFPCLTGESTPLCVIKENGLPYLSPDGTWLAIANKARNEITFHNSGGELMDKHSFADIKNLSLAFSADSCYCAINIPNIQQGQTSGFIILFDKEGKQLWQFEHTGSTTGSLAISENGDNIIYSSENELISINQKGKQNWIQPLAAGGTRIAISQNGKYLALCRREDNSVSLYNAGDGALIWKKKLGGLLGYNSPFTSLEVLSDGEVITAIAKSWSVKNDKSYLYIIKGAPASTPSGAQITAREYDEAWIKAFVTGDRSIIVYSKSWAELCKL